MKFIKILTCILSWLTISPLFYYLAKKWEFMGKKLSAFFMFISPLFIVLYMAIGLYGYFAYASYERKHKFTRVSTIERITETKFPSFKVIEHDEGKVAFMGDFTNSMKIKFNKDLSPQFIQELDSLSSIKGSDWSKSNDGYRFSKMWGNEMPAPKGESDDEDWFLSIYIVKGQREATIEYGMW